MPGSCEGSALGARRVYRLPVDATADVLQRTMFRRGLNDASGDGALGQGTIRSA